MNRLPSGTVTFLFTDIEGSTRLAQQHRQTWEGLRARHHTILRNAIEGQHGYVFQIVGDAFCAAFHTAGDALRAAVQSQMDLNGESWGDAVVKVRMGLHTGTAELQPNGEYHGFLVMSHVQRLMSAAHGGQVLISHAAQQLTGDDLPAGVSLLDLGQHQLKDWIRPEPIYQVVAAGLSAEFPPLQTLDVRRHNLPPQLTSFIGRDQELTEIKQAIFDHRIVTLTGSGGTGKTRLSLQAAAELLDAFPDGVWFVELAPLADPDLIPQTVLAALRVGEQAGKPALQSVIEALAGKTSLLILDNCEHLVEASARLVDALLRGAPALRILASSRETLGVTGEMAWHVPSLSLPDGKRPPAIDDLLQCEAVRLFCERARLSQPRFALTAENAPAVAQICLRLDGIPLAIELAAARVRALSVEQIAARLDDRFRLLTGGSRTALPRQQTLRALIDWSYNLLSEQEKILFRRLAVFVGGWMLEAAEQVGAGQDSDDSLRAADVLDLLTHLVDKSLVITEDTADGTRYRLFETTRHYAREMLLASDEMRLVRDRHMHTFLAYAEQATSELHGRQQAVWMARLAREHDNFNAALAWSLDAQPEVGLHLAAELAEYWDTRGHFTEARKWLEASLDATHGLIPTPARVEVIFGAAGLASRQGDIERCKTLLDEGLALAHALDYKPGIALGLHARGLLKAFLENDYDQAEGLFAEALAIRRQLGDRLGIGQALGPLASCALNRYDYAQAVRLFDESLALFRTVGDEREIAGALWNLAEVALWRRDYETARARTEESLALYRKLEDSHGIATALRTFSSAAANQGDLDQARAAIEQSVGIFRALEDRACLGMTLSVLACHLRGQGELPTAASAAQESIALLHDVGDKVSEAGALDAWGRIALAQGESTAARRHFLDGLALQQETKDLRHTPSLLEGVAQLHLASGRSDGAIRLLAAASALRDHIGLTRLEVERAGYRRVMASVRDLLGEASFQTLWAEGSSLTTTEAMDLAGESH